MSEPDGCSACDGIGLMLKDDEYYTKVLCPTCEGTGKPKELTLEELETIRKKIADTYRNFSFWQDKQLRSVSEFEAKFGELAEKILAIMKDIDHGRFC